MNEQQLRIAFLTDSYHEVNGVAHTSRHFEAFAKRRDLPFLSVHAGSTRENFTNGSVTTLQLRRGRASIALDKDLWFDPIFFRQRRFLEDAIRDFKADLVHVTGPSDLGLLGAFLANRLRIPLVASWHTNLHEYAGERSGKLMTLLPQRWRRTLQRGAEERSLHLIGHFYKLASVLLAPNQELMEKLESLTGRPCYLMQRGVDTCLFNPAKRDRDDDEVVIGYVGRLTTEKNVRFLAEIERHLLNQGCRHFRFVLVGQGSEESWLRANLRRAEFTGVLRGEALARAYASMDIFAFPSTTDTFGNVVLEALASGVPPVVTTGGGPKFLVRNGETGMVGDQGQFLAAVERLATDQVKRQQLSVAAREHAETASWDSVFEKVYSTYGVALKNEPVAPRQDRPIAVATR